MKVTIGVSNRHVHISKENLSKLFGSDYELEILKPLKQPGEYASTAKIDIKGPKNTIKGVRILGPIRPYTQVEVSKTDAYFLGVNPPVRDSGDLQNSEPLTLIGPIGEVTINEGCVLATRHIHITNKEIVEFGLEGIKQVKVKLNGPKGGTLENVQLKISDNYAYELHIDTDDANAHLVNQGDIGEIIKYE